MLLRQRRKIMVSIYIIIIATVLVFACVTFLYLRASYFQNKYNSEEEKRKEAEGKLANLSIELGQLRLLASVWMKHKKEVDSVESKYAKTAKKISTAEKTEELIKFYVEKYGDKEK